MGFGSFFWWPFGFAFVGIGMIAFLLLIAFWIWMIVDCAKRNFKNDVEKIVWILAILLIGWVGALVYLIVVRIYNPRGVMKN